MLAGAAGILKIFCVNISTNLHTVSYEFLGNIVVGKEDSGIEIPR